LKPLICGLLIENQ